MSNFKRSSIYIYFDSQDQDIVSPWFSLLEEQWWYVRHSEGSTSDETEESLKECDLVALVVSKNIFTEDGQVKSEFQSFYDLVVRTSREKAIYILTDDSQLSSAFTDNIVQYQHRADTLTINVLDFIRNQSVIGSLRDDFNKDDFKRIRETLENIDSRLRSLEQKTPPDIQIKIVDLSLRLDRLKIRIQKLGDQIDVSLNDGQSRRKQLWGLEYDADNLSKDIVVFAERIRDYNYWDPRIESEYQHLLKKLELLSLTVEKNERDIHERDRIGEIKDDPRIVKSSVSTTRIEHMPAPNYAPNSLLYFMVAITAVYLVTIFSMYSAFSQLSSRIQSVLSPINVDTPVPSVTSTKAIKTPVPSTPPTLNPTQVLEMVFGEIDTQFKNSIKSNIAFNKPEQMQKDGTAIVELILNPSLSQSALATQLVDTGGLATSTAEPNVLIGPNGERVTVATSQIEITPRMKAELKPQDSEAFTVTVMHDNAEQVVSSVETTTWRWSVTAKKKGQQTLELVIYQLVKYDGKEFWHEVETYKADIVVEVTKAEQVKSWWLTIIGTIGAVTAVVISIQSIWKWFEERKKKSGAIKVEIVNDETDKRKKKAK